MQTVFVVSIALGDPDYINTSTMNVIKEGKPLYLRTKKTPAASWLEKEKIAFTSFDDLYDAAPDFDVLTDMICRSLWSFASQTDVIYAVQDLKTDATVKSLYHSRPDDYNIIIIPGLGISDIYQSVLYPYMPCSDLRTISATDFLSSDYDPNTSILITEMDNQILTSEVKLHLGHHLDDESSVLYLHGKDKPVNMPLYMLDRQYKIDHLSAVFISGSCYLERNNYAMFDLLSIMDTLRSEEGCPWDRQQTHETLLPYMIEEAWECVAAIEQHDYDHLSEELGDLLFQIVFHSSIGKTYDEFTIYDVINAISRKMIRRHLHVFSKEHTYFSNEDKNAWELIKQNETGHQTIVSSLDDVSEALPSLKYASKTYKKLRQAKPFIRDDNSILCDIIHTADNMCPDSFPSVAERLGHILICCCELGLNHNIDTELLLHQSVDSLKAKIKRAETYIKNDGKALEHLTFEELGVYLHYVEGEIE